MSTARRTLFLALLLALVWASPHTGGETRLVGIGDGLVVSLDDGQQIHVQTQPFRGEGLLAFTRRLTGDSENSLEVSQANGGVKKLLRGRRYRVPFDLLTDDLQLRALRALFPRDRGASDGWHHAVGPHSRGESLWTIALWFTGRGQDWSALRAHNGLQDDEVPSTGELVIPRNLLRPSLLAALPAAVDPYGLTYGKNGSLGDYAVYRLRQGEALYSGVVVRFTGRTEADSVNALAADLASMNGIPDVTDIATGAPIKIPFEHLLPEFLPPGHPRRLEYERVRSASRRYSNTVQASRLEDITVILDAGHGGQDPGATNGKVWESVYVYDIMLRTKMLLEATTAARVFPTTQDGSRFRIEDRDLLDTSRSHAVLTSPRYPIEVPNVGVNLRWYLANSLHREAVSRSGDPKKTLFISIHADSLHSSLRGAMVYVPAAALTQGEYGRRGAPYSSRKEYRERPRVEYSWKERVRSEGLARELADRLIGSFRKHGLAVHKEKPIRDRIIRSRRMIFVPAVLRYNAVPAKLLLEVSNLNNAADRRLLKTRKFRQQVAQAIVDGILEYYGQSPGRSGPRVSLREPGFSDIREPIPERSGP